MSNIRTSCSSRNPFLHQVCFVQIPRFIHGRNNWENVVIPSYIRSVSSRKSAMFIGIRIGKSSRNPFLHQVCFVEVKESEKRFQEIAGRNPFLHQVCFVLRNYTLHIDPTKWVVIPSYIRSVSSPLISLLIKPKLSRRNPFLHQVCFVPTSCEDQTENIYKS